MSQFLFSTLIGAEFIWIFFLSLTGLGGWFLVFPTSLTMKYPTLTPQALTVFHHWKTKQIPEYYFERPATSSFNSAACRFTRSSSLSGEAFVVMLPFALQGQLAWQESARGLEQFCHSGLFANIQAEHGGIGKQKAGSGSLQITSSSFLSK